MPRKGYWDYDPNNICTQPGFNFGLDPKRSVLSQVKALQDLLLPLPALPRIEESSLAIVPRWIFPKERFFEYEAKDEKWCRLLGIGHEVREPGAILACYDDPILNRQISTLYIHPEIMKRIRTDPTIKLTDVHFLNQPLKGERRRAHGEGVQGTPQIGRPDLP